MRKVNISQIIGESKFNAFFFMIIILGALMMLFDGYDQGIWGGALTVLKADTGIEDSVFGFISSAGMYGMMIGGIVFGMLADRIGRKHTLIICVAIYSLFTGLIGFAQTPMQFTAFKLLGGVGLAGIGPVVLALIAEYSPIKHRALMTTITISSIPVGSAVSSLLCMFMLESVGWRPLFYLALIPILLLPLFLFKMPDSAEFYLRKGQSDKVKETLTRVNPNYTPQDDDVYVMDGMTDEQPVKLSFVESFKMLFANGMARTTILLWIGFLAAMFTSYSMQTWLARLMNYGGYDLNSSLFFLLLFNLCALPAAAIIGFIADRIGFKKTVMATGVIAALIIFALSMKPAFAILVILLILAGALTTGVYNAVYSFITLSYPVECRGTGVGWACAIGRFGGAWGPATVGILVSANASLPMIFGIIAIPYALLAVIFAFIKDKPKQQQ